MSCHALVCECVPSKPVLTNCTVAVVVVDLTIKAILVTGLESKRHFFEPNSTVYIKIVAYPSSSSRLRVPACSPRYSPSSAASPCHATPPNSPWPPSPSWMMQMITARLRTLGRSRSRPAMSMPDLLPCLLELLGGTTADAPLAVTTHVILDTSGLL